MTTTIPSNEHVLEVLSSNDEGEIRRLLRGFSDSNTTRVKNKSDELYLGDITPLSLGEIEISETAIRLATEALDLRNAAGRRCRGVLAGLGHTYTGSHGWHILAMATARDTIGFVDSAMGVAVETEVSIEPEEIEALTVPEQAEGPVASGAAFWTSPDAGEGHRASAPKGWRQLLVDLRDRKDPVVRASGRVVAWGLTTCYGSTGQPGPLGLDGRTYAHWEDGFCDVELWPDSGNRSEMVRVAGEGLDAIARKLMVQVPEIEGMGFREAERWLQSNLLYRSLRRNPLDYSAASAAETTPNATRRALKLLDSLTHGRNQLPRDSHRVIFLVASRLLAQRLHAVGEVLVTFLPPLRDEEARPTTASRSLGDQLRALAGPLADEIFAGVEAEAREATLAATSAFIGDGPVLVDMPARQPIKRTSHA